jgi:hypothetical protein
MEKYGKMDGQILGELWRTPLKASYLFHFVPPFYHYLPFRSIRTIHIFSSASSSPPPPSFV